METQHICFDSYAANETHNPVRHDWMCDNAIPLCMTVRSFFYWNISYFDVLIHLVAVLQENRAAATAAAQNGRELLKQRLLDFQERRKAAMSNIEETGATDEIDADEDVLSTPVHGVQSRGACDSDAGDEDGAESVGHGDDDGAESVASTAPGECKLTPAQLMKQMAFLSDVGAVHIETPIYQN